MPLPTIEAGPWHFDVNIASGGVSVVADAQETLFYVKEAMTGNTGCPVPWTVAGSSDGTTGAMDSVDRWTGPGDLLWAPSASTTTPVGWIVLESVNADQLLLSCRASSAFFFGRYLKIVWSPSGGFTGGSSTVDPTATDEIFMSNPSGGGPWLANNGFAAVYKTHVMQSNDGKHTWVFFCYNNSCTTRWLLSAGLDPVTGWNLPVIASISNSATNTELNGPTFSQLVNSTLTTRGMDDTGGTVMNMSFSTEGTLGDAMGEEFTVPNELSGEQHLTPCGIASSTATTKGRHGRIPDIWFTNNLLVTGTTFPADATRQFAQFGDVVVPWNGVVPETA